ncbi:MAG: hypothetical protein ACI9KE_001331 [Polyangiales bacterium]|jgi:hypothetical protein
MCAVDLRNSGQICRDADDGCGARLSCGAPGTVTHGTFESTVTANAEWRFDERAQMLRQTVCFDEVPSEANGFGEGMYFQFLLGDIDGVGFDYGIRDRTFDLGDVPGVIFSKVDDYDPAHIRLGANSVMSDISVAGVPVGIRMPLMLSVGCYEASLEVTESSAGGDWVEFNISRGGSEMNVGALWFARQNPSTPASLAGVGSTTVIFFGADNRPSGDMPRYDFRVQTAADELSLQSIRGSYPVNTLTNTSFECLASSGETRFLVGGDTFVVHRASSKATSTFTPGPWKSADHRCEAPTLFSLLT